MVEHSGIDLYDGEHDEDFTFQSARYHSSMLHSLITIMSDTSTCSPHHLLVTLPAALQILFQLLFRTSIVHENAPHGLELSLNPMLWSPVVLGM